MGSSESEGRVLAGIEEGRERRGGRRDGKEEGAEMGEGEEMEEGAKGAMDEDQPGATCIVASLRLPNSERG